MTEQNQTYGGNYYVTAPPPDPVRTLRRKLSAIRKFIMDITVWGVFAAMAIGTIFFGQVYPWYWWGVIALSGLVLSLDIEPKEKKGT